MHRLCEKCTQITVDGGDGDGFIVTSQWFDTEGSQFTLSQDSPSPWCDLPVGSGSGEILKTSEVLGDPSFMCR